MHINTVKVNGIYVSYDIENVRTKTQNGKIKKEEIQIVATLTENGKIIKKIYNLNSIYYNKFDYCKKLSEYEYAIEESKNIIDNYKLPF